MITDTFLFVYAKDGKIRCLTTDQAIEMDALKEKDWKHTATLNSVLWIEALVNSNFNVDCMINELKVETND